MSKTLTSYLQLGFIALLLVSIPTTIILSSRPQDNRSNAQAGNQDATSSGQEATGSAVVATVTPTPPVTSLYLELNLEGFNGTQIPIRTTEPISVQLKNTADGKVTTVKNATLVYSPDVRHFVTTIGLPQDFVDGNYIILVDPASYLAKNLGTFPLKATQQNELTFDQLRGKILLGCDPNNDNRVDAVDMQAMLDTLQSGVLNPLLDITFDNKVDIFDHNVCFRNLDQEAVGDTFTTTFVSTFSGGGESSSSATPSSQTQ